MVLAAAAMGALLAEVAFRVGGVSYPVFYVPDEHSGVAHLAGAEGWYTHADVEGRQYIRLNGESFRDRERTRRKPANAFRIAVLGDSFTEAFQVSLEESFPAQLELNLSRCLALSERKVEVLNFGVSGFDTGQELMQLRHHVWEYGPDLVLLAFLTENDVADNVREWSSQRTEPFFILTGEGLETDLSFRSSFRPRSPFRDLYYVLLRHSRVAQVFHRARGSITEIAAARQLQPTPGGEIASLRIYEGLYREPDEAWSRAWQLAEALVSQMAREVDEHGARFLLVTLSYGIQVNPDPSVTEGIARQIGVPDLFYPDRRLRDYAERSGIEALIMAPELRRYALDQRVHLHGAGGSLGDRHWNALGHRVAGEMLAAKICEQAGRR